MRIFTVSAGGYFLELDLVFIHRLGGLALDIPFLRTIIRKPFELREMAALEVPIIVFVIGEGGSGGALGIGVGDKIYVLENAYYSVISPEGCAAILWRDSSKANEAAEALKLTAKDLLKLGLVDEVIQEPLGGAHRNPRDAILNVKKYIIESLRDLKRLKTKDLLKKRYQKLRLIGNSYIK